MATIQDGLRDIVMAGIGAVAITGEKAKEIVDNLIEKGALSVDQGKEIVDNLVSKGEKAADQGKEAGADVAKMVADAVNDMRTGALEARMKLMTPEERTAFASLAAEIAERENAKAEEAVQVEAIVEEVVDEAAEEAGEAAEAVEEAVSEAVEGIADAAAPEAGE